MFWTDEDISRFVEDKYPWFFPTFCSYPDNIQRVDAVRYLILYEFGGIYSDLDIICIRSLEPLLCHEVAIPATKPCGYSNDLMLAEPKHPFFLQTIYSLEKAHHHFSKHKFLPRHFRIMLSTGSLYLTRQHQIFPHKEKVFIIPGQLYSGSTETSFVRHTVGNSWHGWDSRLLGLVHESGWIVLLLGVLFLCAVYLLM